MTLQHCSSNLSFPMRRGVFLAIMVCLSVLTACREETHIYLAGSWQLTLEGESAPCEVLLPGTTDINQKGIALTDKSETTRLSRPYSYRGKAWYEREIEIPAGWSGSDVWLFLERTKPTDVYVDGELLSQRDEISTPQLHNLGNLSPGKHQLKVMVDNNSRVPQQVYANSHAYTEDTQTNWNGIIGEIYLHKGEPAKPEAPKEVLPCFHDFRIEGKHFYADGKPTFLRGKTDNCVWPLTGHVAMDEDTWTDYLRICQEYGINHLRFHSWCPPEAAFAAADKLGFYMQPELPFWGALEPNDTILMNFLYKEGENILRTYGHHPSFVMFALGNELWGDVDAMAKMVTHFRGIAPDKLYTFGTNYYLGYQGVKPEMDFFVTCRVGGEGWGNYHTHTRGSFSFADVADGGVLNHFYPNTVMTLGEGCELSSVPVISHETGQFQTYPDYDEIGKYTGVLYPHNMEVFRDRLEKAGMADQMKDFHLASGRWSVQLYKADIELDLRTKEMAGFQLLDLQDYPGQGSAYVGILDAFMDSKGICTPEEWRQWCSPVVPLAILEKYCFRADEALSVGVSVANYGGESLQGKKICLTLSEVNGGKVLKEKVLPITTDSLGLVEIGEVAMQCAAVDATKAHRLELRLAIKEGEQCLASNSYPLWIYPTEQPVEEAKGEVIVTRQLSDEVGKKLEAGANVLLMPDSTRYAANTVGALFMTDYWNYRMFKTISQNNGKTVSPGTLGILTNPEHPLFKEFPTEMHTNWQWFPVIRASYPLKLDNSGQAYRPIVQVIDNVERNHKLGLVFEFAIGKGKLLVVMSDLEKASAYPEGKQFYLSVLKYMNSADFNPQTTVSLADFHNLMTLEVVEGKIGELNNISPY